MRTLTLMAALGGAGVLVALLVSWQPAPLPAAGLPGAPPDAFAFVRSMAGTAPDGALRTLPSNGAPAGVLVVDAELGHLFDYYLAGLGETSLAAVRAEIERVLELRLTPAAAVQAKALLGRYLAYKAALATLEQRDGNVGSGADAAALKARLEALRQLRRGYFSDAESAGLFGADDLRDADAVARMAIAQDRALSPQQKLVRLAALDRALPPLLREDREAPLRIVRTEEMAQALRAQGAGDDAVYRLRAQQLSPGAADRLAQLDVEEAQWRSRIAAYLGERTALADEGARAQLRARLFTEDEQRRLPAYE